MLGEVFSNLKKERIYSVSMCFPCCYKGEDCASIVVKNERSKILDNTEVSGII